MFRNVAVRILVLLFVVLMTSVCPRPARADDGVWINTSGGNWMATGNWQLGDVAYGPNETADFSTLNITADVTVHNDTPYTEILGQMIFGDTSPTNNWTVDGNAFFLQTLTGTPTIKVLNQTATISAVLGGYQGLITTGPGTLVLNATNTFGGNFTIAQGTVQVATINNAGTNGPLGNIGGAYLFTLGSSGNTGTLRYTGATASSNLPINIASNGTGAIQVDNAATSLTLSGMITAPGTFRKDGAGTLVLSAFNIFSNGVVINAGTLTVGHPFGLGFTGFNNPVSFTASSTASLNLNGYGSTIQGLSTDPTIPGAPTVQNANATPATLTIDAQSNSTYAGILQDGSGGGALSVTKIGPSTLTLTGTNTFTGPLTIKQGAIKVPTVNNASTNGPLGNHAGITLGDTSQTGTLQYAGPTASSSMPLALTSGGTGAVQVDSAATNLTLTGLLSGAGGFTKTGPGTLTLTAANTFTGPLAIKQGALAVSTINNANSTGQLGSHANVTLGDTGQTGTLQYTGPTASTNMPFVLASGGTGAIQVDNAATNLTLSASLSGSGAFAKTGPGTLTLSSSFAGALTVAQGTLVTASTDTWGTYSSITLGSNGQTGTLQYTGGKASSSTPIILAAGGNGAILTNSLAIPVVAGVVSGGGGFIKSGTGGVALAGINTFTGGLTIQAGTLYVNTFNNANTDGPLGHNASITIGAATLDYGGGTASSSMPILLSGGAANLSVGSPASPLTLGGPISGAGSLTKSDFGSLTLAGNNSYTGGTTLSQGALTVASPSALGTGPLTMGASTTLNIAGGISLSVPAPFTLPSGAKINASAGSFSTGGNGTNHGTYSVVGGALSFNASAGPTTNASDGRINLISSTLNLGSGANKLSNAGRLNLIDSTVNGDIDSSPGGTINAAGSVTFNGSITGSPTLLISGDARLAAPNSPASAASLSIDPGASLDLTTNSLTIASISLATLRSNLFSHQLFSSTADNDPQHLTALGYTLSPALTAQISLTHFGDANLDGVINADDYALIDRSYAKSLPSAQWTDGDFNYDGQVSSADYLLIDSTYLQQQGGALSPTFLLEREARFGADYVAVLVASVPEPSLMAGCGIVAIVAAGRRRRRR